MRYSTHWPSHIEFGSGSLSALPNYLLTLPKPIVAVVDPAVRTTVEPFLTQDGPPVTIIENSTVDPSWDAVEGLRRQLIAAAPRTLIGCGGGSTLDVVKALAHVPPHLSWSDIRGVGRVPPWDGKMMSLLIPTTAGTGSEVSPSIVLADPELNKAAATSEHLVADVAWIDPRLIVSAPINVTRDSGIDALTHSVEAYLGRGHNPLTDALALKGIDLLGQYLPRLVSGEHDDATAEAVAQGSLLGGIAFSIAGLGAIHGLSYSLSHRYHLSHGRANALLLGPVLAFNQTAEPERVSAILRAFPVHDDSVSSVRSWLSSLGVATTLDHYGGDREDIETLTEDGFRTGQRLFGNNARPVTAQDVRAIMMRLFHE